MKKMQFGDKVTIKKTNWLDKKYHDQNGVVVGTNARDGSVHVSFKWPTMKSKWISKEYLTKGWK